MKLLRVLLTAIGYLVILIGGIFITANAVDWMTENLAPVQFMMASAGLLLMFYLIPAARHFTDKGQRWPWEEKR